MGRRAERQARRYLMRQGYRFIGANFATEDGEIDLILFDGNTLVFVEVRARSNETLFSAEQSITTAKQRRVGAAARSFRYICDVQEFPYRFDTVTITADSQGEMELRHIPNAFTPPRTYDA